MGKFYRADSLSHEDQIKILRRAYELHTKWWFDELDCSKSFHRVVVPDISFDDAMAYFTERDFITIIERESFSSKRLTYLEVGFRTSRQNADYFLWIELPMEHVDEITKDL